MPRESLKAKQERAVACIKLLKQHYPKAQTSLTHKSVYQLLVATILSAQCTDERVNIVTPSLFKKYPSIKAFADADLKELAQDIFTTGFFNSKAKSIKESARQILERHGGKVPKTLDELVKLQGVGRKTASVVLGAGYGLAEGIVVDTHVGRISRLLGFTSAKDPVKVEQDLMKIIPHNDWIIYSHLLIFHGRAVCKARKPDCASCILNRLCPFGQGQLIKKP
ncbi:MAG TPA: endonuclease III [candidate division Zixibacteria bacterium]|nr:endonuclease III [candidate division Zixibacteria bacterium]